MASSQQVKPSLHYFISILPTPHMKLVRGAGNVGDRSSKLLRVSINLQSSVSSYSSHLSPSTSPGHPCCSSTPAHPYPIPGRLFFLSISLFFPPNLHLFSLLLCCLQITVFITDTLIIAGPPEPGVLWHRSMSPYHPPPIIPEDGFLHFFFEIHYFLHPWQAQRLLQLFHVLLWKASTSPCHGSQVEAPKRSTNMK